MVRHVLISDGPAQPYLTGIDSFWSKACAQFLTLGDDYQVRALGIEPIAIGSLPIIASKANSSDRLGKSCHNREPRYE
jgi:hypothetical protein